VRVLREEEFLAGGTDTAYFDRHDPVQLARPLLAAEAERSHALAAAVAVQASNRADAGVWAHLPSGWRNNPSARQEVRLRRTDAETVVRYAFDRAGGVAAEVEGQSVDVQLHAATPTCVEMSVDGVRRRYAVHRTSATIDVDSPLGSSSYTLMQRFTDPAEAVAAGSLVAPMPGSVVRVLVEAGAAVTAGMPLVVLEAMKMEHTVTAVAAGTVSNVQVTAGQQVDAGAVLVVVDEEDSGAD
jgi:acetyl/propionyl-CoA carboxylase alpha subunit